MTPFAAPAGTRCASCRWFETGGHAIERSLPGLSSLSSAAGASRAGDGWCVRHDRLLRATARCAAWEPAAA